MSMTTNSGKKIAYFEGSLETMHNTHKRITSLVEDMRVASGNIRSAATDRAYNATVDMAQYIDEGIVAFGKAAVDILTELSKQAAVGPALVASAKRLLPEAEEVAALHCDAVKVSEDVISGRGLDEQWTPATISAFTDCAADFIRARKDMINEIADLTAKSAEEDFKEVYMTAGRHLEAIANNTVDAYNVLREQLSAASHGIDQAVENSLEAAGGISKVEDLNTNIDLTGGSMDV